MAWKATFEKGVACFKRGNLEQALVHMNQAAELDSDNFIIYDSRAAVHEKLGNIKAALLDSKRVIDLARDRWQGYARSARLFNLLGKHGHAIKMADHALNNMRPEDVQRRAQLVELREEALAAQASAEKQRLMEVVQTSYLLGRLPVETLVDIFTVLITEDHTWAVRLSHVCGHWRHILINTPSVWQTLVLSRKHPLRKAKLWKERARNRVARISFDTSELDTASVLAELQDLSWDSLSSLRISNGTFIELHHMLSGISLARTFLSLGELALFKCTSLDELPCFLSGSNWKLRVLRLNGIIHMMDEWWERIRQLKEIHLCGPVVRFSPLVFPANLSLETLVLDCPRTFKTTPNLQDNLDSTSMDNLKTIKLEGISSPSYILGAISTPSISHFSMGSAIAADETLLQIASRPSLVELHIASSPLNPSTLPTLLSLTANLETLQVTNIYAVVNEMLEFLTPKTVDPLRGLPCRALKHIDVSYCLDLTTSNAYAFVKTRAQYASESVGSAEKCAVIESLKVDGCPNIEADMLPWFRSKVTQFSCIYISKKDSKKERRQFL